MSLRVENLTTGYGGGPPIVDGVSLDVQRGTIAAVLGPNGAGKSTCAKAIVGLLPIRRGAVYLGEANLTGLKTHDVVRRGLAYLPQVLNVFSELSVIENLEMGGYVRKQGVSERIEELFELFPDLIADRRKRAGALSGGQQRMLALARMLVTDPIIAVLDEPTAGLSPRYADMVWERLGRIRDLGVGMLVIEQNAHAAMEWSDSVYVLAQGRHVMSGLTRDVREHEEIRKILVG